MGFEDEHFHRSEDSLLDELLANSLPALQGLDAEQQERLHSGGMISAPFADHTDWKTVSGKIQIVDEEQQVSMPQYQQCHGGEYPLQLIAVPSVETLNSIFLERDELVEGRGPMVMVIHPDDADVRSISDGDEIVAFNDLGEVPFSARVTPLVAKGAVAVAGIFKSSQSANRNLVNALHHERLSDIGEATTLNDNTVDIRR